MRKQYKNIMVALALTSLMPSLTSCEDWFDNAPESEMVFDDFWKKKGDVLSGIGSCYRAMNEEGFLKRLIVWGEVRSDNVIYGKSMDTELSYMLEANINADNSYSKWADFYTVINYCNTVIKYAPGVRSTDPDFSETELLQYLAEAKTIRAFCYFTLLKTFRDIPFTEEPYTDDSRPFQIAQSSESDVLGYLVKDLREIEDYAVDEYASVAYNRGRITRKAVWALLADIYLWMGKYDDCVTYCNKILDTSSNPLSLERASSYFRTVFFTGNSDESIWEIAFDNNTQNGAVRDFYGGSSTDAKLSSYDYSVSGTSDLFVVTDLRQKNAFVEKDGFFMIKKYIAYRSNTNNETVRESDFTYGDATNNWIVYRLPDIYLMKAEALAELGGEANLAEAVSMVSKTYDRANPDLEPGTLIGQYSSQEQVRSLVFNERQREFLFEGKRYFDLVRRMRREGTPTQVITNYLINKYVAMNLDRNTVMSKLNDVDAIYMPINSEELRVNTLLKQNRFYEISSDISKN